jgi:hypothetical protein
MPGLTDGFTRTNNALNSIVPVELIRLLEVSGLEDLREVLFVRMAHETGEDRVFQLGSPGVRRSPPVSPFLAITPPVNASRNLPGVGTEKDLDPFRLQVFGGYVAIRKRDRATTHVFFAHPEQQ